jgi:DNA-binding MarR family transcriptional regulator
VRTVARLITNAYDDALRPSGLRVTQFALLVAIGAEQSVSITALARLIDMDRTTLSRNLKPLEKDGLIAYGTGGWGRSRALELTAYGKERFQAATPLWERAQEAFRSKLGDPTWTSVSQDLDTLIK